MSADLAEMTKAEAVNALQSLRGRWRSMKADAQRITALGTQATLVAAGGAIAGALQVKMPKIPGSELPSDAVLGASFVAAAVFGWADKFSDQAMALGSGMLAVAASREVTKALQA